MFVPNDAALVSGLEALTNAAASCLVPYHFYYLMSQRNKNNADKAGIEPGLFAQQANMLNPLGQKPQRKSK